MWKESYYEDQTLQRTVNVTHRCFIESELESSQYENFHLLILI